MAHAAQLVSLVLGGQLTDNPCNQLWLVLGGQPADNPYSQPRLACYHMPRLQQLEVGPAIRNARHPCTKTDYKNSTWMMRAPRIGFGAGLPCISDCWAHLQLLQPRHVVAGQPRLVVRIVGGLTPQHQPRRVVGIIGGLAPQHQAQQLGGVRHKRFRLRQLLLPLDPAVAATALPLSHLLSHSLSWLQ